MIFGIDLDNTIVSYDTVFHQLGRELGCIPEEVPVSKNAVRDHIRKACGDHTWQVLQAEAYGPRMSHARLIPGVTDFFRKAKLRGDKVFVISHKTRFASLDSTNTDLRYAAMQWLETHRFFGEPTLGLKPQEVFFETTRREKINRILNLNCGVLIDDLEAVLRDPALDKEMVKIHFAPHQYCAPNKLGDILQFRNWNEIANHAFWLG